MKQNLTRREALGMLGVTGAARSLARCGETPTSPSAVEAAAATTTTGTNAACAVSPSETVGPYPSLTDLFRSDIRAGKSGAPLTLTISVVNVNNGCSPVSGANVEIWQCDADGHYSQYTQPGYNGVSETFLRGIQTSDSSGRVTFTTIYPGWYQGRATHIHVDVTMNGRSVKGDADCVSRESHGSVVFHGCIRGERSEPDGQRARQCLCRQRGVGTGKRYGQPDGGVQRDVYGGNTSVVLNLRIDEFTD
jgi:intradiol ring-cleaving dioxygenase-like protein